jgi:hypothetical protein
MPSLNTDFDDLVRKINDGRGVYHTSFEPIYYLIFSPKKILEVKRQLPAWEARLKNNGWDVHIFSIAEHISDLFSKAPMRSIKLKADRQNPLDWKRTTASLGQDLVNGEDHLQKRLESILVKLEDQDKVILLVTDLEALHPYLRIGAIEAQLQGKFSVPTVFLYPGTRHGRTNLRFLGFYPEDGNYRSVHVGG